MLPHDHVKGGYHYAVKSTNPTRVQRGERDRRRDSAMATLLVAAALTTAAIALGGGPLVPVWVVALVSLFRLVNCWLPAPLSAGLAVAIFFAAELLVLRITPLAGLAMVPVHVLVWLGVALAAGLTTVLLPGDTRRLNWHSLLIAAASATGSVVVLASMLATQLVPGALKLIWAMNGDTVNAMGFARRMLMDGGIDPASTPQPTPLPFAMAASNMESGRDALAESSLLEHDVARTAQVWVFIIALTCLLVGITVAHAMKGARLALSVPVIALSSSVMLVWYVIGVQFMFGFMNTAFALALLCAAWLMFAAGDNHTLATLTGLLIAGLGILAVWSPLVICMAGLGVVVIIREASTVRRARPRDLAIGVAATALFAGYALTVTVPGFMEQSSALGSDGGFPPIGPASIIVITALTFLAAAIALLGSSTRAGVGTIAVIAGFCIGLGYLLLQRQGAAFGWGYYPAKFAWTTSILLLVILMTLVARLLLTVRPTRASSALLTVAAAGTIASLFWGPVLPSEQLPLVSMISGRAFDQTDAESRIVFALAGRENGQDVLWRTTGGDQWANSWLLQIDRPADDPVKIYATVPILSAEQLCTVIGLLGEDVVVHTSDPAAGSDLAALCPDAQYSMVTGEF